jgi:Tat protein translocase TatB subunit
MFGIGFPELIIILIVALLVVGPKKLPEVARSVGRALGEFRRMADDVKDSLQQEIDKEEEAPGGNIGQGAGQAAPAGQSEAGQSEAGQQTTHPSEEAQTTGQEPPAAHTEQEADDPYRGQYGPAEARQQDSEPDKQKGA